MKHMVKYKITDEQHEALEKRYAKFPDKSNADILRELLSNALSLKTSPTSEESTTSETPFSRPPKRQEEGDLQETQSVTRPLEVDCYYHAFNPKTGKHFCEEKPIDEYACLRRYQRFTAMGKRCYPKGKKFKPKPRKREPHQYSESETRPFFGDII